MMNTYMLDTLIRLLLPKMQSLVVGEKAHILISLPVAVDGKLLIVNSGFSVVIEIASLVNNNQQTIVGIERTR